MIDKLNINNAIVLDNKVQIYVPSEVLGKTAPELQNAFVQIIGSSFANLFGGATIENKSGLWLSDDRGIVEEHIVSVAAYCTDDALEEHLDYVLGLARLVKDNMRQDAVTLIINGTLYLI